MDRFDDPLANPGFGLGKAVTLAKVEGKKRNTFVKLYRKFNTLKRVKRVEIW